MSVKPRLRLVHPPNAETLAKASLLRECLAKMTPDSLEDVVGLAVLDAVNQCLGGDTTVPVTEFHTYPLQLLAEVVLLFMDHPGRLEEALRRAKLLPPATPAAPTTLVS